MVRQVWSRDDVISIANRIAKCGTFLVNWDEQHKAIFREKIRNSKLQMNRYKGRRDPISIELYRTARNAYIAAPKQQDVYWQQMVKQIWLTEGDMNTKFFQVMANRRRKKNNIDQLQNSDGEWVTWANGLDTLIVDFYAYLFTSQQGEIDPVLDAVEACVTVEQNELLSKPFAYEEIKDATLICIR